MLRPVDQIYCILKVTTEPILIIELIKKMIKNIDNATIVSLLLQMVIDKNGVYYSSYQIERLIKEKIIELRNKNRRGLNSKTSTR